MGANTYHKGIVLINSVPDLNINKVLLIQNAYLSSTQIAIFIYRIIFNILLYEFSILRNK